MYELMLTHSERMAINWVGNRYGHGTDLYRQLLKGYWYPLDANWDSDVDIRFEIPEYVAWRIRDIGEEDNFLWTCFSPEFAQKMNDFCDKII